MLPEEINEKTTVAELAGEIVEHPNLWGMHSIEDAINKIISFRTSPPPEGNTPASEQKLSNLEIIHKGIEFSQRDGFKTGGESYRSGLAYGYSCGYEKAMEEYASQSPPSLQEREKGMKWVNIIQGDNSTLPKEDEEVFFDGGENPPVYGRVKYNGKHPCIILLDSSGEEEFEDVWKYEKWLDESEDTAKQSK